MTPIPLLSRDGTLTIVPPDELCAEALRKALSFRHRQRVVDAVPDFRRGGGRPRRGSQYETTTEPLFVEGEDGTLLTHEGMRATVVRALEKLKRSVTYERYGTPWPVPVITRDTVRELDGPQRTALVKLLTTTGGAMAQLPTGAGKTRCIAGAIRAYPGKRILIVTHAASVVRGLQRELNLLMEADHITVGILQGAKNRDVQRVTVATVGMLPHLDPEEWDVLIGDEVHRMTGNSTAEKIMGFTRAPHYGLSATIAKRFDGKEKFLEACWGPLVYDYSDQEAEEAGRVCPVHAYFLSVPSGPMVDGGLNDVAFKRHAYWRNRVRNSLVADVARDCPPDHQLLVFVETLEHLEWLLNNDLKGLGFEFCHGELKPADRLTIERRFTFGECPRLISTDCLSTGVDPKCLRVTVDASGVHGVAIVQKRGRLRRWAAGKTRGIYINFADEWSERAGRKALARFKECEGRGDTMFDRARVGDIRWDVPDEPIIT